uniref:Putative toxin Tx277 n=1 Tax=Buthus israelis TaxID=2899555 RepID=B8XH49_BUTIS|nr:putative toxin Tx277 [Buthus occitanus israelis]
MAFIRVAIVLTVLLSGSLIGHADAAGSMDSCSETGVCMKACSERIRQVENDNKCPAGEICCTLMT